MIDFTADHGSRRTIAALPLPTAPLRDFEKGNQAPSDDVEKAKNDHDDHDDGDDGDDG